MKSWRLTQVIAAACLLVLLVCTACTGGQPAQSSSTQAASKATPTFTAVAGTPTPTVLYQSSLQSPLSGWANTQNTFAASDGYHIIGGYFVPAPIGSQTNVAISVAVKQISGVLTADYGITFRLTTDNRYEFDISSGGDWYVLKDVNTHHTSLINLTSNAAIHRGLNATNMLEVVANGAHFMFYVNGVVVGQANDTAHPSGEVGIDGDYNAEVVFSNFKVVELN